MPCRAVMIASSESVPVDKLVVRQVRSESSLANVRAPWRSAEPHQTAGQESRLLMIAHAFVQPPERWLDIRRVRHHDGPGGTYWCVIHAEHGE